MNRKDMDIAPFSSDLIVEATLVCDQSCIGCYAPNWVSKEIPADSFKSKPHLFLSPDALTSALRSIRPHGGKPFAVSIRGGEPSRHPALSSLIEILHPYASTIFLETHGRWIGRNLIMLNACRMFKIIVAIAFDAMHELPAGAVRDFCRYLDRESVAWRVVITEESQKAFAATRALCDWCSDEQVVYQQKVARSIQLVRPKLGVVRVDGTIANTLSSNLG